MVRPLIVLAIQLLALQFLAVHPATGQEPLRREAMAFGVPVVIQATGPDWQALDDAIQGAFAHLREIETLTDGSSGTLAGLNDEASESPQAVSEEFFALLQRASWYCRWSDGRHGPLGAWLYASWGLRQPVVARPGDSGLAQRAGLADCDRLRLDPQAQTVSLAPPSRIDLWGFERGFAVDSVVDQLVQSGVASASVRIGNVQRAIGPGPEGKGWDLSLPLPSQLSDLYDKVRLRDSSLAIASPAAARMAMGGVTFPPYLDQRTGQPIEGIAATLAASNLAVDAEALSASAFISGPRVGSHLIAQLQPKPSILWWLGSGQGKGLLTDYNWSRIVRPQH